MGNLKIKKLQMTIHLKLFKTKLYILKLSFQTAKLSPQPQVRAAFGLLK